MGNVKVVPPDAFVLNCKMMYNDVTEMQARVKRMWASSQSERDFYLVQYLEDILEEIQKELRFRLDN